MSIETSRHWGENWRTYYVQGNLSQIMITKPPTNPGACIPSRQPNDPTSTNPATVGQSPNPVRKLVQPLTPKFHADPTGFGNAKVEGSFTTTAGHLNPRFQFVKLSKLVDFRRFHPCNSTNCEFTLSNGFAREQIQPAEPASSAPALLEPA